MMRIFLVLCFVFVAFGAHAQSQRVVNCGTGVPGAGTTQPYMDQNGGACVTNMPVPYRGNGSLATSTTSAAINTMTVNSNGAALPSTFSVLEVINLGATDAAICINGGTCTCPGNTVAATNGVTLPAGKGGYQFSLSGVLSSTPTIVACSGTPTVQFAW
jgi:hypothetical protein